MVDIMSQLHLYVPAVEHTKSILVPHTREIVQVYNVFPTANSCLVETSLQSPELEHHKGH